MKSMYERFMEKIDIVGECWLWKGAKSKDGYGRFISFSTGHGDILAHRMSYLLHIGEITEGMQILHKPVCTSRSCVNPEHLYQGTPQDNINDMIVTGTHSRRLGAHNELDMCSFGHIWTSDTTYIDPGGNRRCRICRDRNNMR